PTIFFLVLSAVVAPSTNSAVASLTPSTVPEERLHSANALLGFVLEIGMVLGASAGALLISTAGLAPLLLIDTLTFGLAALALVRVGPPTIENDPPQETHTRRQITAALWRNPTSAPLVTA